MFLMLRPAIVQLLKFRLDLSVTLNIFAPTTKNQIKGEQKMKQLSIRLIAIALFLFPTIIMAQGSKEEMDAWMAYMTPGPPHKMIEQSNGEWTEEISMWMAPGTEPMKTTGKCVNTMILGGRYQQSTHSSNFMGMPFEGIGILAYDNARRVLQSSWIDNMGTGIMYMEGTWDDASKSCTMTGKTTDPMTGKQKDARQVFTVIDNNNQKMEMYMTEDGKEFKTMEILWKR